MKDEQLNEIKAKWESKGLGGSYSTDTEKFMGGYWARRCLRCRDTDWLRDCTNCGGKEFESAGNDWHCERCGHGFSSWRCPECGTENPISNTFGIIRPKGNCFIATATFGSPDAPEVIFLSQFRDDVLAASSFGRACIRTYYYIGKGPADLIAKSQRRRWMVRIALLKPLVSVIGLLMKLKGGSYG